MRTQKVVILVIAAMFMMLFNRVVHAQNVFMADNGQIIDCSKEALESFHRSGPANTIVEADYPYLKNLECIRNGYFKESSAFNFNLDELEEELAENFELKGTGRNINMEATYDRNGNLVKARLTQKNARIPCSIYQFILNDEENDGWIIKEDEMVVRNFDPGQTEYSVTLSKGNREKVLHFETQGNAIAFVD